MSEFNNDIQILKAELSQTHLTVHLRDERIISIPVKRFPKLETTTSELQISQSGYGIHWPDIDEDISIKAFI